MQTFILAMTLHPEVVRKAQAEIDSVIGADRLPQLSDRPSLPYLDAVIKETLRWNVAAPLSKHFAYVLRYSCLNFVKACLERRVRTMNTTEISFHRARGSSQMFG